METPTLGRALVGREFRTLEAVVAAAEGLTAIDYMATTGGHCDAFSQFAMGARDLEVALLNRGFNPMRGDRVQVWVPEL